MTIENYQSVKDFLEELETNKLPNKGDKILVSIDGHYWKKSIFLTYIECAKDPIICVAKDDEELFEHGDKFGICEWRYWKPISKKKVIKVTKQDLTKNGVDEVQIVENK